MCLTVTLADLSRYSRNKTYSSNLRH